MRSTKSNKISPPLKWHGGKHYLASKVVALMPAHRHYVEPYAGGLSVLLARSPDGTSEVVNDLDGRLTNFWKVLQHPERFERFRRRLEATPLSEAEWEKAGRLLESKDRVVRAVGFFIRCRQSLAGRQDTFAALSRARVRRGMNEQASAWLSAVQGLPAVHARLQRVVVLNRPALEVVRQEDTRHTLFYLDPPYLHETRATTGQYAHEMTERDHRDLLDLIRGLAGKVLLSGYPSALYEERLGDWNRQEFDLANNAAGGRKKNRVREVVWYNF